VTQADTTLDLGLGETPASACDTRAMVPFTIHVTRADDRTDETLGALARDLDRERLVPDGQGRVRVMLDMAPRDAYEFVTSRLDEIDDRWDECLHIHPPPA
jgi:hypothetical protein